MATFVPDLFRKAEELNNQLAGVVSAIKKNNEYLQRKPNDKVLLDMDSRLQNLMKELTESQSFLFAEMRKMGVRPANENPEYRKEKFDRQVCHFYHKLNNNNIKLSKLLLDLQVIKLDATGKPNQRKHLVNNGNSLNGGTVVVNGHLSGPHDDDEDHHRGSSSNEELGSSQQLNGLGLQRLPPKNGLRKKVSLAATGNVKLGRKRKRKEDSFDLVPEITQATALSGGSSPIEEEDADADLQMLVPGSVKVSASNSEASSRSPSPGFLGQEVGDPKLRFMHAVGLFGFDEIPDLLAKVKKDARRKVKCSRRAEYDYSKTVAERKANAARWEKTESLRKKVRTPLAAVKAVTNGDTKYEIGRPSTSAERKLLHKVGGVTIKVATCVACNKPGSVLKCDKCEKYFHVTCHTVDPPSSKWCQDCIGTIKRRVKNKTLTGAASYSSRPFGGACSDSEFYRPDAGLYNVDAVGAGQYLTGAAFGYNQLPSSTFLIPISDDNDAATGPQRPKRPTAASVAAAAAASGRDVTVTAVTNSSSLSTSFPLSSSSPAVVRPNVRVGKHRQSSILLNQLTQPAVLNVSPNSPFHGVSGQSRWQRRWSSDRPSIPSEVSILDWSESRATARPLEQPNYHEVTVELVCNDRNDDDVVVEDDGDRSDEGCVYLEENDSRDRACDDDGNPIDSDDPDEVKQQQAEPEVLNVSSGSSEIQSCLSPSAIKRKRDTSIETIKPSTPPSKRRRVGCDNTRKDFLRSIFPGRYGFKIDIYDDDNDLSSSYSSSSELRDDDEDEQSNDRREHLKLEEAHLSAPPESDLMIISDGEEDDDEETKRMTLDEDENSCSSSSSSVQQLDSNAVPDNNKSDDVVMENKREEDGDCER